MPDSEPAGHGIGTAPMIETSFPTTSETMNNRTDVVELGKKEPLRAMLGDMHKRKLSPTQVCEVLVDAEAKGTRSKKSRASLAGCDHRDHEVARQVRVGPAEVNQP